MHFFFQKVEAYLWKDDIIFTKTARYPSVRSYVRTLAFTRAQQPIAKANPPPNLANWKWLVSHIYSILLPLIIGYIDRNFMIELIVTFFSRKKNK